jgi:hypothetical protein
MGPPAQGDARLRVSRLEPAVCAKVLTYALGESEQLQAANTSAQLFANLSAIGARVPADDFRKATTKGENGCRPSRPSET